MIYFLTYLFIEVMLSSAISNHIGGFYLFMEIIISALFGIFILKNFKFSVINDIKKVRDGSIRQDEFIKSSIGKAIGAIFLVVPGFFTDILGVLLQSSSFIIVIMSILHIKQNNYTVDKNDHENLKKRSCDVIDVEVIDNNSYSNQ